VTKFHARDNYATFGPNERIGDVNTPSGRYVPKRFTTRPAVFLNADTLARFERDRELLCSPGARKRNYVRTNPAAAAAVRFVSDNVRPPRQGAPDVKA